MIRFPIADAADQQFAQVINNQRVTFRLRWNLTSGFWSIDLGIDDVPVLTGLRVVLGIDLLGAYDLGLGRVFALPYKTDAKPGREELPSGDVRIYHASEDEIEAFENGQVPS